MTTSPELTVVMPVYNALPYLDDAIGSVLSQSYSDFRFAIYDDHSTDGSYEAVLAWAERDPRITVTRGAERLGPSKSSNAAARMALTPLVARMDADDIMVHDRLAIQVAALTANPDATMIGSTFDMVDARGRTTWKARPGRTGGEFPPIAHPSIVYRRETFEAIGGYRENADYFEDRDLFLRMAERGKLLVVNLPLMRIRVAGQHTRLSDDLETVLAKVNRLYQPTGPALNPARPISPMAFYSIAMLAMFSSRRPRVLSLMLRRVRLDRPVLLAVVTAVIALAEVSPRLARNAWRVATTFRNWVEKSAGSFEPVYEWRPSPSLTHTASRPDPRPRRLSANRTK